MTDLLDEYDETSGDEWISARRWDICGKSSGSLNPGDLVVLGGCGAPWENGTAVVACRVSDGHLELLGSWEKPTGAAGEGWEVDRGAVDACVADAMARFEVVGTYFNPSHWADTMDVWHVRYAGRMRVGATERRPLEWWVNRPTQWVRALKRFHRAVLERRVSFTPPGDLDGERSLLAATMRRHVLNARRHWSRAGVLIRKVHPKSNRRIEVCVAAVLAWECRGDAIAAGIGQEVAA